LSDRSAVRKRQIAAARVANANAKRVAEVIDIEDTEDGDIAASTGPSARRASAAQKRNAATNRWMRWLHVYTSMISLLVVLFFGLTGLTLNHPSWSIGGKAHHVYTGILPAGSTSSNPPDYLKISETMRSQRDVIGEVTDYGVSGNDGRITWNAPGYEAALTFDVQAATYTLTVDEGGLLAMMNDVHKGRNAPRSWHWIIDLSALLLVFVAVTGLGIQLFQRKRRTRALIVAGVGVVLTVVLIYIAVS
jgi:hypothetical protein